MKGAMALFTMSFSLAHIASSKTGLTIIDAYGYQANWFVMGSLGILSVVSCIWLQNSSKRKDYSHSNSLGIAEGAKLRRWQSPHSAMRSGYTLRYGGLLLSLTRPHFQNNICIKDLSNSKISSENKKAKQTEYLVK
jgi:hypothetical protein